MPDALAKLIPTIILVATIGYLAWSHYDLDAAAGALPSNLPEISADLLRPTAPPPTERDPFGKSVRFELGETSDERPEPGKKTGAKTAGTTSTPPPSQGNPANPGDPTRPGTTGADQSAAAPAARLSPAEAAVVVERALAELVLNATLLSGDQRVAMINGLAYRPGDPVAAADADAQLRVAEIHHHHVVLEREGKQVDLTFANEPTSTKPQRGSQLAGQNGKIKTVKTGVKTRPGRSAPPRPQPPDAPPQALSKEVVR
jgi:hypothetical protein